MSQAGIYNENKMVWWWIKDGCRYPKVPKQVQLILSGMCNQDCHFCAYRMSGYSSNVWFAKDTPLAKTGHNNPQRWMDGERAMKLVDEIADAGCLAIQFTGGGEPTVHPQHEEVFVKTLHAGLRASLVSNGVRWSENLTDNILPLFDWVRVSIDAGIQESYTKIRRCPSGHWDKAWGNLERLAWRISSTKSECTLGAGFVVTPQSYKEIVPFALRARDHGAHNIRFTAMFSNDDELPFTGIYDAIRDKIDEAKALSCEGFDVYDNFGSRMADLKQHSPDYETCSYQNYTTYIGDDLKLYRCCVLSYNPRGFIGSLKDTTFGALWNSIMRKSDFAAFDARGCERCQFNSKNKNMLYVIGDDKPEHIEWP